MFKNDYNDPDSMITCRLWRGSNKAGEVLDTGRYTGPLLDVFDNALTFIERNTKIGWKKLRKVAEKKYVPIPGKLFGRYW